MQTSCGSLGIEGIRERGFDNRALFVLFKPLFTEAQQLFNPLLPVR